MNGFIFTKKAAKIFLKLEQNQQDRIRKKLLQLKEHEDIFSVLKTLKDFDPATHRLRVGNYRLILFLEKNTVEDCIFVILDLGRRDEIYQ